MHVAFIPYGKRSEVELLFRDMEAQKFLWKMWRGKKTQYIHTEGQLRILPFGIYEYIFPKEHEAAVLNVLKFNNLGSNYGSQGKKKYTDIIGKARIALFRKLAGCKPAPKDYDTKERLFWITQNVKIIPLGVRYDAELTEKHGRFKGWTHESL